MEKITLNNVKSAMNMIYSGGDDSEAEIQAYEILHTDLMNTLKKKTEKIETVKHYIKFIRDANEHGNKKSVELLLSDLENRL